MAELSLIDIEPLFGSDDAKRHETDRRIRDAVFGTGGFVIANYPDADKVDARAETMLSFFDLADDHKRSVASRVMAPDNERIYRGYMATLGAVNETQHEIYDIGPDDPVGGPPIPGMHILAEENIWPAVEPVSGWSATMRAYYQHMDDVAMAVMLSVGRAAGFSDKDLLSRFDGGNSTLRLLNYPELPIDTVVVDEMPDERHPDGDGTPLASGRHTDGAGVSLLWQRQPGLQAQAPDGQWRDVPRIENCISVHLGDVLETMTDGEVPATPHRVVNLGSARQSVGYFLEPALSAPLSPIESDDAAGDPLMGRGTYGWHLLRRLHNYPPYKHLVPWPS